MRQRALGMHRVDVGSQAAVRLQGIVVAIHQQGHAGKDVRKHACGGPGIEPEEHEAQPVAAIAGVVGF